MRQRFLLWFLPAGIGLMTALTFASGLVGALSGRLGTPVADAPRPAPARPRQAAAGNLLVVALGDSLTRGAGDQAGGYPARLTASMRKAGRAVDVANLGVDGFQTEDLLRKIGTQPVAESLRAASLVCISISGNDLTHALPGGSGARDPLVPALARARANLKEILRRVREANPDAPIRLLGLYNPFPADGPERQLSRESLLLWNVALEEASLSVPGALVVPLADVFEDRSDRLSPDRFHPGPSGYDEIAGRIFASLPRSLAQPPG